MFSFCVAEQGESAMNTRENAMQMYKWSGGRGVGEMQVELQYNYYISRSQ